MLTGATLKLEQWQAIVTTDGTRLELSIVLVFALTLFSTSNTKMSGGWMHGCKWQETSSCYSSRDTASQSARTRRRCVVGRNGDGAECLTHDARSTMPHEYTYRNRGEGSKVALFSAISECITLVRDL